jgi:hypothetical protein
LIDKIETRYPKSSKKGAYLPNPLATMLQIHLMQQWNSFSNPSVEEAVIGGSIMRRFAWIDLDHWVDLRRDDDSGFAATASKSTASAARTLRR